jgi:ketosteroid isomerase-like protein
MKGVFMTQVSDSVRKFFEDFERASNILDLELLGLQYSDSFMFASPQGTQPIKKDDFLKVLPKRQEFFKTIGLISSKITALDETRLDENYIMIKAHWNMQFEKNTGQSITDETSATYVLFQQENILKIVFQLDHQDLTKRVQELGLLPAKN